MKTILRFTVLASILLLPVMSYAGSDIRDYYSEPGINPYKSLSQHPNESISTFNGSLTLSHTDIVVPGNGGLDIKINRIYNGPITSTPLSDPLGQGWTMHFGRIVVPGVGTPADINRYLCQTSLAADLLTSADNPSIEFADGAREILFREPFSPGAVPRLITKSRIRAECLPEGAVNKGGTGMIVTATDGTRYTMNELASFSNDGGASFFNFFYTTRIEDTNGNWINIEYKFAAGQKVIDKITTNDNREIRYSYINEGTVQMALSRIDILNSGIPNQTWKYQYSEYLYRNVLTKVIRPDGSEWNYRYDQSAVISPSPLLSQVTYPWGGKINYTYRLHDFIPGLGISRKPVVATKTVTDESVKNNIIAPITGTWTFDYSQGLDLNGNGIVEDGEYDKTTVTTPTAVYTYEHIGIFTSAASRNLWATGLPIHVTVEDKQGNLLQRTTSSWDYQTISNEQYTRGRGVMNDLATYAPILISKSIFRDNVNYVTNYSNHNAYGKPTIVTTTSNIANESKQIDYTYFIDVDRNIVKQEDEAILTVGAIDRAYDANGNLLSVSNFGVTTNYTYYPTGDISTETDARQNVTAYSNYFRGAAQQINYPENVTVYRTINDSGTLKDETNGRGYTTRYSYDNLNRLSGIDYPINNSVSINYGNLSPDLPRRPMTRILIRGMYKEKISFDGFGRVIKTIRRDRNTGERIVTRKEYDILGRIVFESYPNSRKGTSTTYDALNRVSKIDNIDNTFSSYTYGPGNRTTITDERENTTELTYRSYGSPDADKVVMRINKPEADILTSMSRNILGQLVTVWQGPSSGTQGYMRSYGYDNRNYLTTVTNPETGVTTYGRDALGNMQSRQVGSSGITTYTYDYLNRLGFIDYPGTTEDVTYTYDANSNVEAITNANSAISYQYDSNDNKYYEQVDINGQTYTTGYTINQLDNLDSITYHSGRLVSYSPDAFGRATVAAPFIDSVSYHPNSQIKQMAYANGQVTATTLNKRRWVKEMTVADGETNVVDLLYKYDKKGNVKKITDNLDSTYSRKLKYDAADRLKSAKGQWGKTKFVYDSFGNIRKKKINGIETIFNYSNNRLVQMTGVVTNLMRYDNYGNITSNGRNDFIYDDAGNMLLSRQATLPGAPPSFNSTLYKYDGNNMRVIRSRSGNERHYLFAANGNQLGEYAPASGYLKEHVYLGSSRIASVEDTLVAPVPVTPVANAGADVTATEGTTATLDGSLSTPGTGVTYSWVQTSGPTVTLTGANTVNPTFTTPSGLYSAVVSFQLNVTSQTNISSTDSVTVTVTILDNDNDGLSDNFEIATFGDLSQTGIGDFDNDGLTNLQEWQQGSDPKVVNEPDLTVGFFAQPGNQQNTIYWVPDARIQNYDLYWSTNPGVTPTTGTLISNVTSPYVHTGRTNGQAYYYILVATSACCQAISTEQEVTTGLSGWSDASLVLQSQPSGFYNDEENFAMNQAGQGMLVWSKYIPYSTNPRQLFARRFDPVEGWLAAEKFADGYYDFYGNNKKPTVDIDEDGDVVILYRGYGQASAEPQRLFVIENNVSTGWSTPTLIRTGGVSNMHISYVNNDYAVILWLENQGVNNQLNMVEYRKGQRVGVINTLESSAGIRNDNLNYGFYSEESGNALLAWYVQNSGVGINIENKIKVIRYSPTIGWSNTEQILDLDELDKIARRCESGIANSSISTSQQGYLLAFSVGCYRAQNNSRIDYLYSATYSNNRWVKEVVVSSISRLDRSETVYADYFGAGRVLLSKSGTVYFASFRFLDFGSAEYISHKAQQDTSWSPRAYTSGYSSLWDMFTETGVDNFPLIQEDINGNLVRAAEGGKVFTYSETNGLGMPVILDKYNGAYSKAINLSMDGAGNGILLSGKLSANYYTLIAGSPTANAGPSAKIIVGQTVTLNGTGSSDANGNITSYTWEQIAGSPVTITNANSATASVTPQDTSAFKLTVVDDQGLIQTDSVIIEIFLPARVENNIANAGSNQVVTEGDMVTLDASASTPVSAYLWRQVSGPAVTLVDPFAATTTFYAPQVNADTPIEFELLISNGSDFVLGSLAKSSVTVTVQDYTQANLAPVVNAGPDQSIISNNGLSQLITLAGNVSDADGSVTQYRWKQIFGPLVGLNNPNSMTPSFTAQRITQYGNSITYVFELSATDNRAVTTTDTVSITHESRQLVVTGQITNSYNLNGYNYTEVTLSSSTPGATINFGFDTPLNPDGTLGTQFPFSVNDPPYVAAYRPNPASYPQTYSVPILIQMGENLGNYLRVVARATAPDGTTVTAPITIRP